jgi:hypothetical protein
MSAIPRWFKRFGSRFGPALQSDTSFIEAAYLEILGRPADQDGLDHYRRVLREGLGRTAVLLSLMRSAEFTSTLQQQAPALPDLRALRPDRYRTAIDRTNGLSIPVFVAQSAADFDWLEAAILEHGYYEKPGVWNLGVDADKRVVAEIIASFAPQQPIELGCAAGAVLECLLEYGVTAEGVEISSAAIDKASARVRSRIHQGDLLSLELDGGYDMMFGLDVFEHLNPNRLDRYVQRLASIARDGAWFFCNIPAFGEDVAFGTVFPLYVDAWQEDAAEGRAFSTIHVDELGYPIHGHLTWGDADWWVKRFEAVGLERQIAVERALHLKYDAYMEKRSPARRAYFVFAKQASLQERESVARRIAATSSKVLAGG